MNLNFIINNLNLINLPSSLWGIHIDPKCEYVAILHVSFMSGALTIDKGIVMQYDNLNDKIQASIFLYCKNVSPPQINPIISSINDLSDMIFSVHALKFCDNWHQNTNKNDSCLMYVDQGFDRCVMCNSDVKEKFISYDFQESNTKWKENDNSKLCDGSHLHSTETVWQTGCSNEVELNDSLSENLMASSEDVDVVVKQILEMEYTNQDGGPIKEEIDIPNNKLSDSENDNSNIYGKVDNNLACRTCSKVFTSLSNLARHERIHSNDKNNKYVCKICNKQYLSLEALNSHMHLHTGENLHKCEICKKKFTNPSHLKVHLRKHTGERPFACEFCNKRFFTKSHLKEHVRLHTGERPYKCHICNKTNSHQSAHQRHVMTHSNVKPNLCNICGKTFCKGYRMEDHMITHSTERPYECEVCQKSFAKAANLKIHQKTHTGVRPYVCSICGKCYTTQSNLGTHMKSHTG